MKAYRYESLLELTHSEVLAITAVQESFKVIAEEKVGRRICEFLENERAFAQSNKSLIDRLRYAVRGFRGMLIPNFMPLWNRAVMDGFVVNKIEKTGSGYDIFFSPRPNSSETKP